MATKALKSIDQLYKESAAAVKRNLGIFVGLSVLSILDVAWQVGQQLKDKSNGNDWGQIIMNGILGNGGDYPQWGGGLVLFLLFVAAIILGLMFLIATVHAAKQRTVKFDDVWADFKQLWLRLIVVEILTALLIGFSFLLLIIPGIIILPRLIMAPILLVDQKCGIMEALNRSWDMTKGYWSAIWLVVLFGIVLNIASIIPVVGVVLAFILTLFYSVALPLRYFELKKK